jgi:hypothetical protein
MRVFIRSNEMDVYEVRPRKDKRGVDLISDALPFGALCWHGQPRGVAESSLLAPSWRRERAKAVPRTAPSSTFQETTKNVALFPCLEAAQWHSTTKLSKDTVTVPSALKVICAVS